MYSLIWYGDISLKKSGSSSEHCRDEEMSQF